MTMISPQDRLCDCHCPLHQGFQRPDYNASGCACLVTCPTQPMTLLVDQWRCALFLHPGDGHLWFVMSLGHGQWDWESANEIDDRTDVFVAGQTIEALLRKITAIVAGPAARHQAPTGSQVSGR
jgi:hypothetical protein